VALRGAKYRDSEASLQNDGGIGWCCGGWWRVRVVLWRLENRWRPEVRGLRRCEIQRF
jgi:hypothetical protein